MFLMLVYFTLNEAHLGLDIYERYENPIGLDQFETALLDHVRMRINAGIGDLNAARTNYTDAKAGFEATKSWILLVFTQNIGAVLEGDSILDEVKKSLAITKRLGKQRMIAANECHYGHCFQLLGRHSEARELNRRALKIATDEKFDVGIGNASLCLGMIALDEGRIRDAIELLEQSRKYIEPRYFNQGYGGYLSEAYRIAGMYDKALEVIDSLPLDKIHPFIAGPFLMGWIFLQAILAAVEAGDLLRASKYQDIFHQSITRFNLEENVSPVLRITEAIMHQDDLESMVKARNLLRQALADSQLFFPLRVEAIRYLSQLLLKEYEIIGSEPILEELFALTQELVTVAREQNLLRIGFEANYLQSKLHLLQGNIDKAKILLEEEHKIAKDRGLHRYAELFHNELSTVETEFQKMVDMVDKNISIKERVKASRIMDYLTIAKEIASESN